MNTASALFTSLTAGNISLEKVEGGMGVTDFLSSRFQALSHINSNLFNLYFLIDELAYKLKYNKNILSKSTQISS